MLAILFAVVLAALPAAAAAQPAQAQPAGAPAFETAATAAILVDHRSGEVLYAKNPDQPIPPASMSKLMTARVVFDEIQAGNLSLDQELPVSEKAWRMGGSRMFVEVDTRVKVSDLLRGVIVQSGNDACVVLAEALAGSEEAFARLLDQRAAELGLEESSFANSTGWPDPEHRMSVSDLALLAGSIIRDYPNFYDLYSIREFEFNGINQQNRNPLLRASVPGVDGMKTGYTAEAGYGLVASAERDGRRLVLVVAGLESGRQRGVEAQKLLEYGFRQFEEYRLFEPGRAVVEAAVWQGEAASVPLASEELVAVTLPRAAREDLEVRVVFDTPVPAPVLKGQAVGEIVVRAPGREETRVPLVAAADVPRAGLTGRMTQTLQHLVQGVIGGEAAGVEGLATSAVK